MVSSVASHHSQMLKGLLDMCVLALIAEEPTYGYALVERLEEKGLVVQNEASVYLVLKRLDGKGRIEAHLEPSSTGPARKVYQATDAGRDVLLGWMADWAAVRDGVDRVLTRS